MAIINSDNLDQSEKEELVFKIKNELNEYFKFVDLLQKSRSTKSTRLIEEYIKKESNILRRINFIEELDREQRFADRVEPQVDAEEIRIAKQKIEKRKISFNLTPSSFLTYLFSTRKSIKNFGLRTGIIESGIFSLRMTGHSEFHYKNLIVGVNSLLIKSVNYILENGWMKLDRRSYNTVVIFSRYLKQFFQAGNIINRDDNKLIFKNLEQFISPYLQVVSKRIYKDLLKESFYEVLYFEPSFKSKFRDMVNLLDEILNTESRGTCFFNIVMGIIIIKFRNFVKFSDLLDHYNIQDIEDTKYDFSPKVRQQIQDKLDSLEFKYKEAEEKLFFLRFVGEDLSLDAKENNPLTQIFGKVYFYDKINYPETFDNLKADGKIENWNFIELLKSDLSIPILKLLKGFLTIYSSLLKGKFPLKSGDNKVNDHEIFKDWIFSKEVNDLHECQRGLDTLKGVNSYLSISFEVYNRYNKTGKIEIEKEERICSIFRRMILAFYSISEKLATILHNHYITYRLKNEEIFSLSKLQNEPIIDIFSEPRLIPYAALIIKGNKYLEGSSVMNTLNEIMLFSVNLAYLFSHQELSNRTNEKQKLIMKVEDYLNIKSKLDD